ncbi:MAG TPA: hypothetical protein VF752_04750 [Thermoleophilaceae bacterium]
MRERQFTDAEVDDALEALTDPERFSDAEARVAKIAPQLQRILASALHSGGWLEAHESEVAKALQSDDPHERMIAVRTLLAEETRLAMLVGVAVGWELARELEIPKDQRKD